MASDPRVVRFRQAGREARNQLRELAASSTNAGAFHDRLSNTLRDYLAAKLDMPPGAIERQRVLARLDRGDLDPELKKNIERFFELAERARYARGTESEQERSSALQIAEQIVRGIERDKQLARRLGLMATVLAVVIPLSAAMLTAGTVANADDDPTGGANPHTEFFEGNLAYKEGRYADAQRIYERIVGSDLQSPALHFNLGNAYFKTGDFGRAILNYERARRSIPRDPDLLANLSYAQEQSGQDERSRPLWLRVALPLATSATTGELLWAASLCWWLVWLLLGARLLLPESAAGLGRAGSIAAVAFAFVAANAGYRLVTIELEDVAVVTVEGEEVVRYEPSESGTEYFRVGEGSLIAITDRRKGWVQIRRGDGRRGWLPEGAAELVVAAGGAIGNG
ncbi:MAG: tetratricopeptide repeat protein [Pseudomonadales bacterium]|nr:tetratricopeptide repeat protein [Pseudomonadales bacterium]